MLDLLLGSQTGSRNSMPESSSFESSTTAGLSLSFLLGSALHDWFRFLVVGMIVDALRGHTRTWIGWFVGLFYVEVVSMQGDASYDWLQYWVTSHPSWRKSRYASVSTLPAGVDEAVNITGTARMYSTSMSDLFLRPPVAPWYHFWHGSQLVAFRLVPYNESEERQSMAFQLRIYTLRGQHVVAQLLAEAEAEYRKLGLNNVDIFRVNRTPWETNWIRVCSKRARPIKSVVLDPGVLESLIEDLRLFINSREWYRQRGIPCRRGYLLHGPPGTGKSSLIAALAAHLELEIYSLSLSSSELDDETLSRLLNRIPRRAILLIEDIDAAQRKLAAGRRDLQEAGAAADELANGEGNNGLTLAGLLNALDGIDAPEGRILFVTTNHKESLDPALCRPGRMDVHVRFDMASKYQAKELFRRFYPEAEFGLLNDAVANPARSLPLHSTITPVASSKISKAETQQLRPLLALDRSQSPEDCLTEKCSVSSESGWESPDDFPGPRRSHGRSKGEARLIHDIEVLAVQFSELIPERGCSMASLQEYLMGFRTDPEGACSEGKLREFLRETLPNFTTLTDDSSEGDMHTSGPKEGVDEYRATDNDGRS